LKRVNAYITCRLCLIMQKQTNTRKAIFTTNVLLYYILDKPEIRTLFFVLFLYFLRQITIKIYYRPLDS